MRTRLQNWVALAAGGAILLAGGVVLGSRVRENARTTAKGEQVERQAVSQMLVPHRQGELVVDGEFEDAAWQKFAGTSAFVGDDGAPVHPHSEARFVWDEQYLYLLLYAADENVQAKRMKPDDPIWEDDSFHLLVDDGETERSIDLSARGVVADGIRRGGKVDGDGARPFDYAWTSGARVAADLDGTLDDPSDDDEEWVLEVAIPWTSLGVIGRSGARLGIALRRCDTPKQSRRVCGAWPAPHKRGVLVLTEGTP